eukprot:m51a1_g2529 hypothetical protein (212) ;mRNA; r:238826-239657
MQGASPVPVLALSSPKVYLCCPFTVTIVVSRQWLALNRVTAADVWSAGFAANVRLEGHTEDPLESCARCCKQRPGNASISTSRLQAGPTTAGDEAVFVFDKCRSYCNSSRLHLGGRVVIAAELRGADGSVVCRLVSEPFTMCSKSSRRTELKKSTPAITARVERPVAESPERPVISAPGMRNVLNEVAELEGQYYARLVQISVLKELLFQL